jgi:membrane-associated protease RseP (regulator of RpoE activity)
MSVAAVIGIVAFALGVMASIALHEVGHLVPAKRFGVKVTQYMVGFGPTVWSRHRGDTEYGVKAVPLGGYIRMIGMFPPKRNAAGELVHSATTTGPFQSMMEDARRSSMAEVQPGDEDRVFYRLPVHQKLVVMLGGPTMNLLIAGVLFTLALSGLGVPQPTPTVAAVVPCVPSSVTADCTAADAASPAQAAGLQTGDVVVAVDGAPVTDWTSLQQTIRDSAGQTLVLTVDRGDGTVELPVDVVATERPSLSDPQATVTAGYLGVAPAIEQVRRPVTAVPGAMWDFAIASGKAVLSIPSKMVGVWQAAFGGGERDPNGPVSVVGAGRFGVEVATDDAGLSWRVSNFLVLLASLNMALFLFNLIPLLPLDGGHVAGALYEGARRQVARWRGSPDPGPVDVAKLLPVAYGVAMVLIGMSALLIYADVVNPIRLGG